MADEKFVGILSNFSAASDSISLNLENYIMPIFAGLLLIQITLFTITTLMKYGTGNELYTGLARIAFIATFTLFLMSMPGLLNDLFFAILEVGKTSMTGVNDAIPDPTPSNLLKLGASLSGNTLSAATAKGWFDGIGQTLLGLFIAFFILIIMALAAAEVAIVWCKFYVLIGLQGIFIALNSFDMTREITKNYLKAILGLGLQIMSITIMIGIFFEFTQDWKSLIESWADNKGSFSDVWSIPGQLIVFYLLLKNLPPFIASLSGIGGFTSHGEAAVMMGASVAAQGAKMAAGAPGMAVGSAGIMAGKAGVSGVKGLSKGASAVSSGASKVGGKINDTASLAATGGVLAMKNTVGSMSDGIKSAYEKYQTQKMPDPTQSGKSKLSKLTKR